MGNDAPELLPCPFCGAHLERDEDGAQHPGDDCVLSQVYIFDTNLDEWNRRADLASPLAAVKVKPLEWEQLGRSYRAKAPLFGNIRVESYFADKWSIYWSAPGFIGLFTHGEHDTPDLAKAAAQADYDARIRAALEPDTAPLAAVAMLDAAAKLCDERGAYEQRCFGLGREAQNYFRAGDAIRALPLPDHAALLRAAMALLEVKRLVSASLAMTDAWEDSWTNVPSVQRGILSPAAKSISEALAALKGAA